MRARVSPHMGSQDPHSSPPPFRGREKFQKLKYWAGILPPNTSIFGEHAHRMADERMDGSARIKKTKLAICFLQAGSEKAEAVKMGEENMTDERVDGLAA